MSFKGCNFVAYPLLYVKIRNQDELGNFNSFLLGVSTDFVFVSEKYFASYRKMKGN